MLRNCRKCGVLFDKNNCPACAKINKSIWYIKNRESELSNAAIRYKNNSEKIKECHYKRYHENPEKYRAISSIWRISNPEKSRISKANYYSANLEKMRAKSSAWSIANPDEKKILNHNYRAKKRSANGRLSNGLAEKLFKLQKGKCACCGESLGSKYHLDHIMPLALGGTNTDDNIQILKQICNLKKHSKHPIDFMQEKGFLL